MESDGDGDPAWGMFPMDLFFCFCNHFFDLFSLGHLGLDRFTLHGLPLRYICTIQLEAAEIR